MSNFYYPGLVPTGYDRAFLVEEFAKIASVIETLEVVSITLIPSNVAPDKLQEGMVVNADGTNWNPGAGAGLYEYVGGAWSKL